MGKKHNRETKEVTLAGYILQTLVTVVPLSVAMGYLAWIALGSDKSKLLVCLICFFTAGLLLAVFASLKNYVKFVKPLNNILMLAKSLNENDLTQAIDISKAGGQKALIVKLNQSVDNFRKAMVEMKNIAVQVAEAPEEVRSSLEKISIVSDQVAAAISELAKGATEQAASIEKISSSISGIVSGLNSIDGEMGNSDRLAQDARNTVLKGQESVRFQEVKMKESKKAVDNAGSAVSALEQKSNEIGQILEVINGIAEQTNLLSLNAAIEAARAGEMGKGFAVVANEVRNLAEQSGESVHKIAELIKEVQLDIHKAVSEMGIVKTVVSDQEKALTETVGSFRSISDAVETISENVRSVNASTRNLSDSAAQAEAAINQVADIAEEAAAGAQQVSASTEEQASVVHLISEAAENLSSVSERLKNNVQYFKV